MQVEPKKQVTSNRRHFAIRLNLFFFATFFLFSVLIVRLAILQFVEGPSLKEEENSGETTEVQIPPIRGNIYDSGGAPIAYSTSTQSLYYTMPESGDEEKVKEKAIAAAKEMMKVFNENGNPAEAMTLKQITDNMDLDHKTNTYAVPRRIKAGLTNEEIANFLENKEMYPGIDILEESIRHYDPSTFAVQLVGYLKQYSGGADLYKDKGNINDPLLEYLPQENVGFDGLEYMYQDELRGKNGLKLYPVNAARRIIGPPTITKPEKGDNLYLTINREVQERTEQAIMDHLHYLQTTSSSENARNAKTGYAVAMEVKSGKIISMASMPDYDPNIWKGGRIGNEDYVKISTVLQNGTISPVIGPYTDKNELNKHPSSVVFLGSTQKPLSILIGLNEKLFTISSTWTDNGSFSYGREGKYRRTIGNALGHAYGTLDPALAISKSSNPFMAKMVGNALYETYHDKGVEIWDKYVKQFGLGVSTESGLHNESYGVIGYFDELKAASSQSALIFASFGQMGRYTTLQLAQYTATLASHGKRMKPQFVKQILDSEGNIVQDFKSEVLNTINFPDAYWEEVERGMAKVDVPAFKDAPYNVMRKTGTSEQQVSGDVVDNAVFIAYAPAEDPVLAVAVVVPEGGFGSAGAAPIARKIFDAYDEAIGLDGVPKKQNNNMVDLKK